MMHKSPKYFLGPTYSFYQSHKGKICPDDEVVGTEGMCTVAATDLKLVYQYIRTNANNPPGCYFIGENAYFNELTIPNSVNLEFLERTEGVYPNTLERTGGVCVFKGSNLTILFLRTVIFIEFGFFKSIL